MELKVHPIDSERDKVEKIRISNDLIDVDIFKMHEESYIDYQRVKISKHEFVSSVDEVLSVRATALRDYLNMVVDEERLCSGEIEILSEDIEMLELAESDYEMNSNDTEEEHLESLYILESMYYVKVLEMLHLVISYIEPALLTALEEAAQKYIFRNVVAFENYTPVLKTKKLKHLKSMGNNLYTCEIEHKTRIVKGIDNV